MPITWAEYHTLGPTVALTRLLPRHEHLLAWRLAEFLGLSELQAAVVHHWCCAKIHDAPASLSDEALLAQLRTKMQLVSVCSEGQ